MTIIIVSAFFTAIAIAELVYIKDLSGRLEAAEFAMHSKDESILCIKKENEQLKEKIYEKKYEWKFYCRDGEFYCEDDAKKYCIMQKEKGNDDEAIFMCVCKEK